MKKFSFVLVLVVVLVLSVGCSENAKTYKEAVKNFEEGKYGNADVSFNFILPADYKDTQKYRDILASYQDKYNCTFDAIILGDFETAQAQLDGLPDNYTDISLIEDNFETLHILLCNEWEDEKNGSPENAGWTYSDKFEMSGSLYIEEDEYSDDKYMGTYKEYINMEKLLENKSVDVNSDERSSFTLDISHLDEGYYTTDNGMFVTKYVIKK